MTRLERIARDLAAVLSPKGEGDWRRFLALAEEVGIRLYRQFAVLPDVERSGARRPAGRGEPVWRSHSPSGGGR